MPDEAADALIGCGASSDDQRGSGSADPGTGAPSQADDRFVSHQVIRIHVAAPPKPAEGEPCNGCGVCCASEPCPLGVLASRRARGACAALVWTDAGVSRCGLVTEPASHLPASLRRLAPLLSRLARRFISSGSGCDCSLSVAAD